MTRCRERDQRTWTGRLADFVDRRLEREKVRFVCLVIIGMSLLLIAVSVLGARGRKTVFGPAMGADYAAFYVAGTILNHGPNDRLYDLRLQDRLYHRLMPRVPARESLPFANAPFLAPLFRPLAVLPYSVSFVAWLVISAGLYGSGLALLGARPGGIPASETPIVWLLAFSFFPFLMECWAGGQVSTFGFFWFALALRCQSRGREGAAGAALAFCAYKPTLLLLVLPMLVLGRRWRTLGGFLACGLALALVSLVAVGWRGCMDYAQLLLGYTRMATAQASGLRLWKFVDLNSFFKMLLDGRPALARSFFIAGSSVPILLLARAWWRVGRLDDGRRASLWACTLTWTLVCNLYVGVYDSILVVPSLLLTAHTLYRPQEDGRRPTLPPTFTRWLALLYIVPWISQHLARSIGFQPYTLVLAAVGVDQLMRLRRDAERPGGTDSAEAGRGVGLDSAQPAS